MNKDINFNNFPSFDDEFEDEEAEFEGPDDIRNLLKSLNLENLSPDGIMNMISEELKKNLGVDVNVMKFDLQSDDETDNFIEETTETRQFYLMKDLKQALFKVEGTLVKPIEDFFDRDIVDILPKNGGEIFQATDDLSGNFISFISPYAGDPERFQWTEKVRTSRFIIYEITFKMPEDSDKQFENGLIAVARTLHDEPIFCVPLFGNSIGLNDNGAIDLLIKSEDNVPINMEKIIAQLEVVFQLQDNDPGKITVGELGRVLPRFRPGTSKELYAGSISLHKTPIAKEFLKDYNIEFTNSAPFYIELSSIYNTDKVADLLMNVDFFNANFLNSFYVYPCNDGVSIKLNIETLQNNIANWERETKNENKKRNTGENQSE